MPASPDTAAPGAPVVDDGSTATTGEGSLETKGERTRRRLLEIAVERFGAQGYKATSVSEIARAAGLTQAAVYAYFESKEQLFDAAVDTDAEAAILAAANGVATTPAGQLVPMVLVLLVGGLGNHPLAERVLAGKEPDTLPRLVDLPALRQLRSLIADRVRLAQAAGEVRPDVDADQFADGAEAIILSLLMSITVIGQATETRRQLGVLTIFDAALRPSLLPALG
jgi:AcrR family transcriptional regulator